MDLTTKGRRVARDLQRGHEEFAHVLFADMPARQSSAFTRGLDAVLDTLRAAVSLDEEVPGRA